MPEEIFVHKHIEEKGDIVEIRISKIAISEEHPEGVLYSCAYIRNGERLVAYDNHGEHGAFRHHRHIKDHIEEYPFHDEWKLLEDFNNDIEKIRRGIIQ